jgi:hypothetical protein
MQNYSEKPKKISLINENGYLTFLSHAGDGIGYTHQAIITDGHKEHSVYASFYPAATHSKSLVNEITAYLLASALNLPIAPKAFIVIVKADLLQSLYPRLAFSRLEDRFPLWCISTIPGHSPKFHYNLSRVKNNPVFQADIHAWPRALDSVVFDDWLGNSDRNTGNLIRTGKHNYVLIDHEDIAGSRNWESGAVHPEDDIRNKLAQILWGGYGVGNPKDVNKMIHFAKNAMQANFDVLQELVYWWKLTLTESELTSLHRFIMKRATICPELIRKRFGGLL